jgi:hypothetical protein
MSESALVGLTEEEARQRRQAGVGNDAQIPPSRTYLEILRRNAFSLVNAVLFGVAALLLWLGLHIDALVTAPLVGHHLLRVVGGVQVQLWRSRRHHKRSDPERQPDANHHQQNTERALDELIRQVDGHASADKGADQDAHRHQQ